MEFHKRERDGVVDPFERELVGAELALIEELRRFELEKRPFVEDEAWIVSPFWQLLLNSKASIASSTGRADG
jgi:hypothetical protein